MKAPAKLKIGGQEFIRQDLLTTEKKVAKAFAESLKMVQTHGVKAPFKTGTSVVAGKTVTASKPKFVGKLPQRVDAPVTPKKKVEAKAQIPKELWAPIFKKIGGNKKLVHALKKLLKAGEPTPLMEFAKANDLDYSALRKIMSLVNPDLHVGETLAGILAKAVRALKDAGVVDPIKIEQDTLWKAWLSAVDEDAKA